MPRRTEPHPLDAPLALAARHDGVLTVREALELGLTHSGIHRLVAAGVLLRRHRGVLVVPALVTSPEITAARAALACVPQGVCSHTLAARLWALPTPPGETRAEVVAGPSVARAQRADLVVHRHRLAPQEITRVVGIPVTTPLRTLVDLAASRPLVETVCAADAALRRGLTTTAELAARAATAPRLGPVATLADPRSESPLETRVRVGIVAGGLPPPEPQLAVVDAAGVVWARIDLGYRRHLVGIECDGREPHGQPAAVFADRHRQNALLAAGWLLLRFTWHDAVRRPRYVVDQVRRALLARGWRPVA